MGPNAQTTTVMRLTHAVLPCTHRIDGFASWQFRRSRIHRSAANHDRRKRSRAKTFFWRITLIRSVRRFRGFIAPPRYCSQPGQDQFVTYYIQPNGTRIVSSDANTTYSKRSFHTALHRMTSSLTPRSQAFSAPLSNIDIIFDKSMVFHRSAKMFS